MAKKAKSKKAKKPKKSKNCFDNRWGNRQCECRKQKGKHPGQPGAWRAGGNCR